MGSGARASVVKTVAAGVIPAAAYWAASSSFCLSALRCRLAIAKQDARRIEICEILLEFELVLAGIAHALNRGSSLLRTGVRRQSLPSGFDSASQMASEFRMVPTIENQSVAIGSVDEQVHPALASELAFTMQGIVVRAAPNLAMGDLIHRDAEIERELLCS